MPDWKLIQTLRNPLDPDWELLIKLTLGSEVHPDRKSGFMLSREALRQVCEASGQNIALRDLILKDNSGLVTLPHYTVSLSHTPDCGAALIAEKKLFRSVGIDIEHEGRVVKDSIRDRISHPDDETLRKIELWCLKEAVFKAVMNTHQFENPVAFASLIIKKNKWSHSTSDLHGEWELDLVRPYVVARAFLKN